MYQHSVKCTCTARPVKQALIKLFCVSMYLTTKIEKEHETVDVALFCYCTVDTTVENSHQTQAV